MQKTIIIILILALITNIAIGQTQTIKYGYKFKVAQSLAELSDSSAAVLIGVDTKTFIDIINDRRTLSSKKAMNEALETLRLYKRRKIVSIF